jgi:hypothetical protein
MEVLMTDEAQGRLASKGGVTVDPAKLFPNGALIIPPNLANQLALNGTSLQLIKREDGKYAIEPPKETQVGKDGPRRPIPIGRNPEYASVGNVLQQRIDEFKNVENGGGGVQTRGIVR